MSVTPVAPRPRWDPRRIVLGLAAAMFGFGAALLVAWAASANVPDATGDPVVRSLDPFAACARLLGAPTATAASETSADSWTCHTTEGARALLDPQEACRLLHGESARAVPMADSPSNSWSCLVPEE